LLNENFNSKGSRGEIISSSFTYSKHLKKAVFHLDNIIKFINAEYGEDFPEVEIRCMDLKGLEFKYIKIA